MFKTAAVVLVASIEDAPSTRDWLDLTGMARITPMDEGSTAFYGVDFAESFVGTWCGASGWATKRTTGGMARLELYVSQRQLREADDRTVRSDLLRRDLRAARAAFADVCDAASPVAAFLDRRSHHSDEDWENGLGSQDLIEATVERVRTEDRDVFIDAAWTGCFVGVELSDEFRLPGVGYSVDYVGSGQLFLLDDQYS